MRLKTWKEMHDGHTYDKAATAALFIDPYNDFLSEKEKRPRVKGGGRVGLLDNLRAIAGAVRRLISGYRAIVGGAGDYETGAIPANSACHHVPP
jgi:hypothetical protein